MFFPTMMTYLKSIYTNPGITHDSSVMMHSKSVICQFKRDTPQMWSMDADMVLSFEG